MSGEKSQPGQRNYLGFQLRLISLIRKEIRQLLRDKSNLAVGIGLPIILILIIGYGLSLDVRNARIAIVLEDASPTAVDVISGLELSSYISPVRVASMQEAERLMLARKVEGVFRVPSNFSRRLGEGE